MAQCESGLDVMRRVRRVASVQAQPGAVGHTRDLGQIGQEALLEKVAQYRRDQELIEDTDAQTTLPQAPHTFMLTDRQRARHILKQQETRKPGMWGRILLVTKQWMLAQACTGLSTQELLSSGQTRE